MFHLKDDDFKSYFDLKNNIYKLKIENKKLIDRSNKLKYELHKTKIELKR